MMTAAHCGQVGQTWSTPANLPMGSMQKWYPVKDVALIRADTAGRVYTGGIDTTGLGRGEYVRAIGDYRVASVGIIVCHSCSFSGERCGSKVTATGVVYNLGGDIGLVSGGVQVEDASKASMFGNGDSGGPTVIPIPNTTRVYVVGIISAGYNDSTTAACSGIPSGNRRICWWRGIVADIEGGLYASKTYVKRSTY